jgi:hypothetical protein
MMASTAPSHELQSLGHRQSNAASGLEDNEADLVNFVSEVDMQSLPPADHGRQAYLVLAGCTLIQAPVWGQHTCNKFPVPY